MHVILDNIKTDYNKSGYDIESIFNIHTDSRNNIVFNINETIYLNVSKNALKKIAVNHPLHWSTISYKLYGTTRLAWFLMRLNNIPTKDIFKRVAPATIIFYIDADIVKLMLDKTKKSMLNS